MTRAAVPELNQNRLLRDLADLSRIGGRPDGGVDRVAWSESDLAARRWVQRRLADAGLHSRVDAAMNVFGSASPERRRRLLIGSHSDSVAAGGRLDGAYGVVAALEVLRTLAETGDPAADHIELVDFADEEGVTFTCGYLGSKALVGELDPGALEAQIDLSGRPVRAVLEAGGADLDALHEVSRHLPFVAGYLELHIEQGPRLESAGLTVAAVEGILGVERRRVVISGRSAHGGTAPFDLRRDPIQAAAQLITEIPQLVRGMNPAGVATIGVLSTAGGAINFTPAEVEFSLELRQPSLAALIATVSAVEGRLREICSAHGCSASIARQDLLSEVKDGVPLAVEPAFIPPAEFDRRMVEATALSCSELGLRHRRMHAGTWHDAGIMSAHVPTGMLLVPSLGGLTHVPAENTLDADLVNGARALLRSTQRAVQALGLVDAAS